MKELRQVSSATGGPNPVLFAVSAAIDEQLPHAEDLYSLVAFRVEGDTARPEDEEHPGAVIEAAMRSSNPLSVIATGDRDPYEAAGLDAVAYSIDTAFRNKDEEAYAELLMVGVPLLMRFRQYRERAWPPGESSG